MDSTGDSSQTLAPLTAASTGLVGLWATSAVTTALAPIASLTDEAIAGQVGDSDDLDLPTITGDGEVWALVPIPMLVAVGEGTSGEAGESVETLPGWAVGSGGATTVPMVSAQTLPRLTGDGSGHAQRLGVSAQALLSWVATGTGTSPIVVAGASQAVLPSIMATAATGFTSRLGVSAQTLPRVTRTTGTGTGTSSGASQAGRVGTSAQTLARIVASSSAHTHRLGTSSDVLPAVIGSGEATPQGVRVGASDQPLPALLGIGTGLSQRFATSTATVPALAASGSGYTQHPGHSTATLPALIGVATGTPAGVNGGSSSAALLALVGDGSGHSARIGGSTEVLPSLSAASSGGGALAGSEQSLPVWEALGLGTVHRVATSILTLPAITGEAASVRSIDGASELVLPMWGGSATAATLAGASILTLPAWIVVGTGTLEDLTPPAAGSAAREGQSFAMNSKTFALVQDTNNAFNSYARLGQVILAANADGVFVLGAAATDNGTAIDSRLVYPLTDKEAALKRCARLVVGYRADGDLRLTVDVDGSEAHEYVLEAVGNTACHPNRVTVGKGLKGRYWRHTIENIGGAAFEIDALDVDWEVLTRRVP